MRDTVREEELGGFFRPSEIAQFQCEMDRAVRELELDMQRNRACMGPERLAAWGRFRQAWSQWYRAHDSLWQRSWGSTANQLERWQQLLGGWRRTLVEACKATPSTPALAPLPSASKQIVQALEPMRGVLNVVVPVGLGIGLLWWWSQRQSRAVFR